MSGQTPTQNLKRRSRGAQTSVRRLQRHCDVRRPAGAAVDRMLSDEPTNLRTNELANKQTRRIAISAGCRGKNVIVPPAV